MTVASGVLGKTTAEFFQAERETHQFRKCGEAMKRLAKGLTEVEAVTGWKKGRLTCRLQTNLLLHCQRKVDTLGADFDLLSEKFADKTGVLRESDGTSFLSADQTAQEDTLRTQATEKSVDSVDVGFEPLELARLSRSTEEISQLVQATRGRANAEGAFNRIHSRPTGRGQPTRGAGRAVAGGGRGGSGGRGTSGAGGPLHTGAGDPVHPADLCPVVEDWVAPLNKLGDGLLVEEEDRLVGEAEGLLTEDAEVLEAHGTRHLAEEGADRS